MSNTHTTREKGTPEVGRIILAVDTATPRCDIVIAREEKILAVVSGDSKIPHSKTFFDNLSLALKLSGLEIGQVGLFAAVTGPGSFTGLRVGLAAIRGLADTCGKPAIGIDRFDLVSLTAGIAGRIMVLLEAGRSEIYAGIRDVDASGNVTSALPDRVGISSGIIPNIIRQRAPDLIIGSGLDLYLNQTVDIINSMSINCREAGRFDKSFDGIQLLTSRSLLPETAGILARFALHLDRNGAGPPLHASYVRPSDAELKSQAIRN